MLLMCKFMLNSCGYFNRFNCVCGCYFGIYIVKLINILYVFYFYCCEWMELKCSIFI